MLIVAVQFLPAAILKSDPESDAVLYVGSKLLSFNRLPKYENLSRGAVYCDICSKKLFLVN